MMGGEPDVREQHTEIDDHAGHGHETGEVDTWPELVHSIVHESTWQDWFSLALLVVGVCAVLHFWQKKRHGRNS